MNSSNSFFHPKILTKFGISKVTRWSLENCPFHHFSSLKMVCVPNKWDYEPTMVQRDVIVCKNVNALIKPYPENNISFNFLTSSISFFMRKPLPRNWVWKFWPYDLPKNLLFIQLFLVEWSVSQINTIRHLKYFKGIQ